MIKEFKFGRIMTNPQIGVMITYGTSIIPKRNYISIELPFLIIQIYV